LSSLIFYTGVSISGQFEHSSPACLRAEFLKVGFNRIIDIDNVIIRAEPLGLIINDKGFGGGTLARGAVCA